MTRVRLVLKLEQDRVGVYMCVLMFMHLYLCVCGRVCMVRWTGMEKVSSGVQNSTVQGSIKSKVREGKGSDGKGKG
jgi:hypothetical protein